MCKERALCYAKSAELARRLAVIALEQADRVTPAEIQMLIKYAEDCEARAAEVMANLA